MGTKHRLLNEFNAEYRDLKILRDYATPSVNVIAVHGLAANPIETWVKRDEKAKRDGFVEKDGDVKKGQEVKKDEKWNWLEKQLVDLLPKARVWTFGYDSSWCGELSVGADLNEVAGKLLDAIVAKNLLPSPIIFVAHSFGGIVVMKSLIKAEDSNNRWSQDRKALGLFKHTDAILFFGTPFRGIDDWFQSELPRLAKNIVPIVRDDVFESFRKESPILDELRDDFINKIHRYNKPNVGLIWEMQVSNVGKIIGDDQIPKVSLVQKDSAILQNGPSTGEPRFLSCGLERNHFNMHKFGESDTAFNSVEFLLKKILPLGHTAPDTLFITDDQKACLNSLSFLEMRDRERDVINATDNTCTWLSKNPVYREWSNQQHGLLWIKGHPGVGKSTLMKYARNAMKEEKKTLVISFFFHARGTVLQHNMSGLFRSLVHQIVQRVPNLLRKITNSFKRNCQLHGSYKIDWEWNHNELRDLFISYSVEAAKTHIIRIYIDALDECGEDVAVDLIEIFQKIAESLSVCFSCRHYPLIALENGLEITVEANNAHDIKRYVNHQLDEQKSLTESFRSQIIEKASGNFQWVKIVARLVSDLHRKRYSPKYIEKQIAAAPVQLSKLYEDLLTSIDELEKPESLKLMQWICYALRPLSVTELRFAMIVDADTACHSINQCQESEQHMETDEDMEIRVRHLSKGLAEVISHNGKSIVQLIHQSVSDFIIDKKGLEFLYGSQDRASAHSLIGRAHFRLSRSCIKYFSMNEIQEFSRSKLKFSLNSEIGLLFDRTHYIKRELKSTFPFLEYATISWVPHAKFVEKENLPQVDLILCFQSPRIYESWIGVYRVLVRWPDLWLTKNTTLLHVASGFGFRSVLSAVHNHDFKTNCRDPNDRVPLSYAAEIGQDAVMKFLMKRDNVDLNVRDAKGRTPLSVAAEIGHEEEVKLLMGWDNVATNPRDTMGRTPLSLAAEKGHEGVMKLLMKRDDVIADSRDARGRTPLSWAAEKGQEAVMKLLLERGDVEINSRNNDGDTPLSLTIRKGHEAMVELLLKRDDVDVNSTDIDGNTPLHRVFEETRSSFSFEYKIYKTLLLERNDINPNIRNNNGNTPFSMAAERGHELMVKLLLERDADANCRNDLGDTPLSLASEKGHELVVKLLLERDADANSRNDLGDTPLSLAAEKGHELVVKLLLERDADANSRNDLGDTPLILAAVKGHEAVMKLLMERDNPYVNSGDAEDLTPLSWATIMGHEPTVKLLVERGADANSRNNRETRQSRSRLKRVLKK